jgi:hypothetical protein
VILDPVATVRLYDEAWAEPDYELRLAKLRLIWAPDGVYIDPEAAEGVQGPEALAEFIEKSLEQYPG